MRAGPLVSSVVLASLVVGISLSCDSPRRTLQPPGDIVASRTLDDARYLVVRNPGTGVFLDQAAWEAFWAAHVNASDGFGNPMPPPAIDFQREMILGVFWGSGFSGCSNLVEVFGPVVQFEDRIEVSVGELPILGECLAIVYPIDMIVTARSDLPIVFTGDLP